MKNENKGLFSRRYFYVVFSIIALFFSSYVYFQYKEKLNSSYGNLEKTVETVSKSLMLRLNTIDKLYFLLEKSVDDEMFSVLEKIQYDYSKEQKLREDYSEYVKDNPFIEIYIISENNRIISSTDYKDIGLDFSSKKKFSDWLDNLRDLGIYYSDRINLRTLSKEIMKYSYYPSHDKKYIFEAGYKMEKFEKFLKYDSFQKLGDLLEKNIENIEEINFYDFGGRNLDGTFDLKEIEDKKRVEHHNKALRLNKSQKYIVKKGPFKRTHIYFPYGVNSEKTALQLTLEIVYSDEIILTKHFQELARELSLITVFLLLLVLFHLYFKRKFVSPLEQVLAGIDRVRDADFSHKVEVGVNNEVEKLANHLNEMASNINTLLNEKETSNKKLLTALRSNEAAYLETVRALAISLEVKDEYTGGHCERVTEMSLLLANYLDLPAKTKNDLKFGSLLHDIGKIGIVDRVLNKPGSFTDEEYELIKQHPETGYNIIDNIDFLKSAKEIVLNHHERIDGKGYPNGLKGNKIPYLARILSITDAFDAMTSKRVYKEKVMTVAEAFQEMKRCSGTQFDSDLLDSFIEAYTAEYGKELKEKAEIIEVKKNRFI